MQKNAFAAAGWAPDTSDLCRDECLTRRIYVGCIPDPSDLCRIYVDVYRTRPIYVGSILDVYKTRPIYVGMYTGPVRSMSGCKPVRSMSDVYQTLPICVGCIPDPSDLCRDVDWTPFDPSLIFNLCRMYPFIPSMYV